MKYKKIIAVIAYIMTILASSSLGFFIGVNWNNHKSAEKLADNTDNANNIKSEETAPPSANAAPDMKSEILSSMTLDEKICQMLFVTPETLTGVGTAVQAGEATRKALTQYPVGGIIYFAQNIKSAEQITAMTANTQSYSKIPLFFGIDEEGGRVSRLGKLQGFEKFPPMSEIGATGDPANAYGVGKGIASQLKPLGFNVDFAPVADIVTNRISREIGDRSFGNSSALVSEMVKQEIMGLQQNGICAAAKHFPGHGSAVSDSHSGRSEITLSLSDMRASDFKPFEAAISAGVEFILVSHITVVNIDKNPASLSKTIITDLLRNELGYNGIITTDSLSMGAITDYYSVAESCMRAVTAGADILLMPPNIPLCVKGIKDAVQNGTISEQRIDDSVRRILETKVRNNIIPSFR